MDKDLLLVLLFIFCPDQSLQQKATNTSKEAGVVPRVFVGNPVVVPPTFIPLLNDTRAPLPFPDPPSLTLQNNLTSRYLSGTLSTRVIPVIYILVICIGVPANAAILCTLATKIRKVSSAILYCSLALSDLFLLLSLIFRARYHLHGNHWSLGETACRLVTACFYGNLYCSAQTLACISVKRYLAVVHPFLYKSLPKRACTAWVCVALWGVFGAAVVPDLVVQQSYRLPEVGVTTCHDVLPLRQHSHAFLLYFNVCLTIFSLLLPLCVTAGCYVRIVGELRRSQSDWGLYIRASTLLFVIFTVCFAPAGVLHFLHYVRLFADGKERFYIYFNVAVCLCCLHSCLDPFLFVVMSKSTGSTNYFRLFKGKTFSISV